MLTDMGMGDIGVKGDRVDIDSKGDAGEGVVVVMAVVVYRVYQRAGGAAGGWVAGSVQESASVLCLPISTYSPAVANIRFRIVKQYNVV